MGRYLDLARQNTEGIEAVSNNGFSSIDNAPLTINQREQSKPEDSVTKETKLTKEGSGLERRISERGFSIAIDQESQSAYLLFRDIDAGIVRHCARVYRAFEITLTQTQRVDLTESLDYLERIEHRKDQR